MSTAKGVACALSILVACGGSKPAPAPGPGSTPPELPPSQVTQEQPSKVDVTPPEVEPEPAKPVDDKTAVKASTEFLGLLRDDKAKIGRCHAAAVANNAALRDRTVALAVAADFAADGTLARLALSPNLGADFEACVKAIATGWTLTLTQKMSFRASLNLTP